MNRIKKMPITFMNHSIIFKISCWDLQFCLITCWISFNRFFKAFDWRNSLFSLTIFEIHNFALRSLDKISIIILLAIYIKEFCLHFLCNWLMKVIFLHSIGFTKSLSLRCIRFTQKTHKIKIVKDITNLSSNINNL